MRSAISILTYNRRQVLQETLKGLAAYCSQYPLFIFDDLSQRDDTQAFLVKNAVSSTPRPDLMATEYTLAGVSPDSGSSWPIKVFLGERNLGVAGNSNRALKVMMDETDADHLCLLNDDLHVQGDFVAWYAQAHQDLGVGMFSFCDFTNHPSYRWIDVRKLGYTVKICPRMTAIMTSMTRKVVESIGYYDAQFGKFGQEHCSAEGTLIWMGDYTFRPIQDVKVGDEVIGWNRRVANAGQSDTVDVAGRITRTPCRTKVVSTGHRRAPVVKVIFESGNFVVCTKDHLWAKFYGRNHYLGKFYEFSHAMPGTALTRVVNPHTFELEPDKVAVVLPVGEAEVFSLQTETGNYIAGGYASKNCDHMNRARFARFMDLDGMMQPQLDVHHYKTGSPVTALLRHQECETSVQGIDRRVADKEGNEVIARVAKTYRYKHLYRPFCLHAPKVAGAHGKQGIPVDDLSVAYRTVTDFWPKPLLS